MARPTVFVDAGALFARYRISDAHHEAAVRGWDEIERRREVCTTTNLVLAEAASLLIRSVGAARAAPRIRGWLELGLFQIERLDNELELEAVDLLEKFADQRLSFTDCASFATMRRLRLKRAFAFDRHFTMAGFEVWPGI